MQAALRALFASNAASGSPLKLVAAVTGGGVDGVRVLLSTEGASSAVLECVQPYSREAFQLWCAGDAPLPPTFQYASQDAAVALATASLRRAKALLVSAATEHGLDSLQARPRVLGVGLAAALRSTPPRRGAHRCHVAVLSDEQLCLHELVLDKGDGVGGRSRVDEDALCGRVLTAAVLQAAAMHAAEPDAPPVALQVDSDGSCSGDVAAVFARHRGAADDVALAAAEGPPGYQGHDISSNCSSSSSSAGLLSLTRLPGDSLASEVVALPPPLDRLLLLQQHLPVPPHSSSLQPVSHVLFLPCPPLRSSAPRSIGSSSEAPPPPTSSAAPYCLANSPLPQGTILLPGSFNPLHSGHLQLGVAAVRAAERHFRPHDVAAAVQSSQPRWRIVYELSAANVDKPPLAASTVLERVAQFSAQPTAEESAGGGLGSSSRGSGGSSSSGGSGSGAPAQVRAPVVVTTAARFIEKARLFPGCAFAVGFDTAARLVDPKYYGGSADAMLEALLALRLAGTVFFVAGRLLAGGGGFQTHDEHLAPAIPPLLRPLFVGIPESDFRVDVSSTQLREAAAAASSRSSSNGSRVDSRTSSP